MIQVKKKEKKYGTKPPSIRLVPKAPVEPVIPIPEPEPIASPEPEKQARKEPRKWIKKEIITKNEQPLPDGVFALASKRVIDWAKVDEMLAIGSDGKEIAGYYGIPISLLKNSCLRECEMKWEEKEKMGNSDFVLKLRSAQWKKALGWTRTEKYKVQVKKINEKGDMIMVEEERTKSTYYPPDTTMQIHLGKHYLGQTDKIEVKHLYEGYVFLDENGNELGGDEEAEPTYTDFEELQNMPGLIDGIAKINIDIE